MQCRLFSLFLILLSARLDAQQRPAPPTGEYILALGGEVFSGFQFHSDGTFEFFFAYGALDRMATGNWQQQGDSIVLNNKQKPPLDFRLLLASKTNSGNLVVRIQDANALLIQNVQVRLEGPEGVQYRQTNSDGIVVFDPGTASKLSLIHEYFPDRLSVFELDNTDNNEFTFAIEPWIADVQFKDFVLKWKDGALNGKHPLLQPKQYVYRK